MDCGVRKNSQALGIIFVCAIVPNQRSRKKFQHIKKFVMKTATKKKSSSTRQASSRSGSRTTKSAKSNSANANREEGSEQEESGEDQSPLRKLLEDGLKDIYWAEKALTKALPKMAKNATSEDLVEALESHLQETEEHVSRLEQIFESLGQEAKAKKCEGMQGLIDEGESMMEEAEEGEMMDATIIAAAQKVEHYEIATYGTLRTFAETLGLDEVQDILEQTLEEEKNADEKLTEIAMSAINEEAAGGGGEQEGEENASTSGNSRNE
jgi:ferritin-like metal-binding protein YciE